MLLTKTLAGVQSADNGDYLIDGEPVFFKMFVMLAERGIALIHQSQILLQIWTWLPTSFSVGNLIRKALFKKKNYGKKLEVLKEGRA